MVKMVDVGKKPITSRVAEVEGTILLAPDTLKKIKDRSLEKGDVLSVAQLTGIQGAKMAPQLMPLCHPIPVESTKITTEILPEGVRVYARVSAMAKTGVEMEALAAVTSALLNIWDMTKMYEKTPDGQYPNTKITNIKVNYKHK